MVLPHAEMITRWGDTCLILVMVFLLQCKHILNHDLLHLNIHKFVSYSSIS